MKALSVRQPWAWLIVNGFKPLENRTWKTKYRGRILIHASKKFDWDGFKWVQDNFPEIPLPKYKEFERGGIVGNANLHAVVTDSSSLWFSGPIAFAFGGAEPMPFAQLAGKLGIFDVPHIEVRP